VPLRAVVQDTQVEALQSGLIRHILRRGERTSQRSYCEGQRYVGAKGMMTLGYEAFLFVI